MNPQGKVSESFGSNHSVCQERGGRAGGSRSFCIKEEAGGGRASAPGAAPAPAPLCGPSGGARLPLVGPGAEGPCANVLTASLWSPEPARRTKRVRDAELGAWSPPSPFCSLFFFFF